MPPLSPCVYCTAPGFLTRFLAKRVFPAAHRVLQDLKRVRLQAEHASLRHFSLSEELYHDRPLVESVEDLRDLRRAADSHSCHVCSTRTSRSRLRAHSGLAHPTLRLYSLGVAAVYKFLRLASPQKHCIDTLYSTVTPHTRSVSQPRPPVIVFSLRTSPQAHALNTRYAQRANNGT